MAEAATPGNISGWLNGHTTDSCRYRFVSVAGGGSGGWKPTDGTEGLNSRQAVSGCLQTPLAVAKKPVSSTGTSAAFFWSRFLSVNAQYGSLPDINQTPQNYL